MVSLRWSIPEPDPRQVVGLSREARCSATLAALLLRRGVADAAKAARFLEPTLHDLAEPAGLPDLERAVARISAAIAGRERIVIFGDYDVDGIASTCLLLDFFRLVECPVRYRLPHRLREGYGLRAETVRQIAAEGADLLITVDNGSSARDEIELACSLGVDVVVVDHHQPSAVLPQPAALVNPWLSADPHLFKDLAGVGVTFKLLWALGQHFSRARKLSPSFREFLRDSLALVALGTVSDVVPLVGENRALTKFGLRALRSSRRPGLRRLVELCLRPAGGAAGFARAGGGHDGDRLDSSHIGFRIGPRLNSAGRLGEADLAIRLLTTEDEVEAAEVVGRLERENERRRTIEAAVLADARRRVHEEYDLGSERAIVLGDPSWHPGVLGIVAARLVEEFHRPTLLFAVEGERARGSARSIPGVHIYEAMRRCAEHLIQFGGHALAAGAEARLESLPALRRALGEAIEVEPSEMVPSVEVDCRLSLEDVDVALLDELDRLAPHGEGNPEPLFAATGVEVVGAPRLLGQDGKHLSFHVREPRGRAAHRAVAFGMGELYSQVERRGTRVSILFQPRWNEWQGQRSIELRVHDIRVGDGQAATTPRLGALAAKRA